MSSDTRARILDAAEGLFAEYGLDGTSLRMITARAEVNLAAVNYHFGSKEQLARELFARRIGPLNDKRLESLAAAGPDPDLETVMDCFIAPAIDIASEQPDTPQTIMRWCGRLHLNTHPIMRDIFVEQFKEVVDRFRVEFERLLPHIPRHELHWRLLFTVGSMAHSLTNAWMVAALGDQDEEHRFDPQRLRGYLVRFCCAGLRA